MQKTRVNKKYITSKDRNQSNQAICDTEIETKHFKKSIAAHTYTHTHTLRNKHIEKRGREYAHKERSNNTKIR